MESPAAPPIIVSSLDLERIESLLARQPRGDEAATQALVRELARAVIVEPADVPSDVVTMNSRIRMVDVDSGEASEVALVYPREADADAGKVSVLAPVGSAILGLRVGQTMEWPVPGGRRRLRVEAIRYQPEASGELHR